MNTYAYLLFQLNTHISTYCQCSKNTFCEHDHHRHEKQKNLIFPFLLYNFEIKWVSQKVSSSYHAKSLIHYAAVINELCHGLIKKSFFILRVPYQVDLYWLLLLLKFKCTTCLKRIYMHNTHTHYVSCRSLAHILFKWTTELGNNSDSSIIKMFFSLTDENIVSSGKIEGFVKLQWVWHAKYRCR